MEKSYFDSDKRVFLFKGHYAIPGGEPKIQETGDREYINAENVFIVERIFANLARSRTFHLDIMRMYPDIDHRMSAFMFILGDVARYYATPQCDYEKLKQRAIEQIMWCDEDSPMCISKMFKK